MLAAVVCTALVVYPQPSGAAAGLPTLDELRHATVAGIAAGRLLLSGVGSDGMPRRLTFERAP